MVRHAETNCTGNEELVLMVFVVSSNVANLKGEVPLCAQLQGTRQCDLYESGDSCAAFAKARN